VTSGKFGAEDVKSNGPSLVLFLITEFIGNNELSLAGVAFWLWPGAVTFQNQDI
jgi:hypothetical protein